MHLQPAAETRLAPRNNINGGEKERERERERGTECGSRAHQPYQRRVRLERRASTYSCLVAILPRDRCIAIQVSFCFERTEKGVLSEAEG